MTADQVLRALVYHGLSLFAPAVPGQHPEALWHARDHSGRRQGFGPTPAEAVANALEAVVDCPASDDGWLYE